MKRSVAGTTKAGEAINYHDLETQCLKARFTDYGATLMDLYIKPLKRSVVLGYDTAMQYEQGTAYLGASVGRVANRLGKAQCTVDGKTYTWTPNNGENLLHSGPKGLTYNVWHDLNDGSISFGSEPDTDGLVLGETVPTRTDGFPGTLRIRLKAILTGQELRLVYTYMTSENSVVNVTNHSYFNLSGAPTVEDHEVSLGAERFALMDDNQIPTGVIEGVQGTPFDLRPWTRIGKALETYKDVLAPLRGYDHHYVLRSPHEELTPQPFADEDDRYLQLCGRIRVPDLELQVLSDAPGYQFYTGNWLDETGRNGAVYTQHSGCCIEPQFLPNDCNTPGFGESYTKANQVYERVIVFRFKW